MQSIKRFLANPGRTTRTCLVVALAAGTISTAPSAEAHITRLEIIRLESPTFGGMSFDGVGQYEKITARAFGEVDPSLPGNAIITDIENAPRNARGMVEYSTDVLILKPIDPARGSGKIFYDVVNRGNKGSFGHFNQAPAPSSVNNTSASGAGTGLLMRRGYTIIWSGWESPRFVVVTPERLTADLPLAHNPDASPIVEHTITEHIFDTQASDTFSLPYSAATLDQSQAYMLVRNNTPFVGGPLVARVTVPTSVWSYVDERTVRIDRANSFLAPYDAGAAFEFVWPARDPEVLGLGFAATRDLMSFLRHDTSAQNPLRNSIQYVLGRGDSQSGRYLKGFIYWGFNADEQGRIVFDGVNPNISGAHAIESNDRFGDSGATGRSYQRHLTAKQEFPFTYEVRTDPISGLTDGIFVRCQVNDTCPKVIHTDSGNEAYLKPTSLVTTDGVGNDIPLPPNVRVYLIGSTQHGPAGMVSTTPTGICQQPGNPNQWQPHIRALGVALDQWVTQGIAPPASRYPRISDGTLVPSLPQSSVGFPEIPGVRYTGWVNTVELLDKSTLPPTPVPGAAYFTPVPKTDADGNEIGGIRTVDVQVPIATYTGWALRRAPFAENEDCALAGQYIPFPLTAEDRMATGDPRLSVQERYPNHAIYVNRVVRAVNDLVRTRLLLPEDGKTFVERANNSSIGRW